MAICSLQYTHIYTSSVYHVAMYYMAAGGWRLYVYFILVEVVVCSMCTHVRTYIGTLFSATHVCVCTASVWLHTSS